MNTCLRSLMHGHGEWRGSILDTCAGLQDAATAASIRSIIDERKANTLKIEALMYYGFIPAEATILFFVADRQSYGDNKSMFEEIRQRYEAK